MQDVPRDSSRLPGQRFQILREGWTKPPISGTMLGVLRSDRKGIYDLDHTSSLLPCRRSDGVYLQGTVTLAEHTEDFRPTHLQTHTNPARPHHCREDLLVVDCVVGSWCMPTPLTGEKEPKSRTSPELALTFIGDDRGAFRRG